MQASFRDPMAADQSLDPPINAQTRVFEVDRIKRMGRDRDGNAITDDDLLVIERQNAGKPPSGRGRRGRRRDRRSRPAPSDG